MSTCCRMFTRQCIAVVCATSILATVTACGSTQDAHNTSTTTTQSAGLPKAVGRVDIVVPSDGFTLSTNTPINTWSALNTAIVSELKSRGFSTDDIATYKVSSLAEQIEQVKKLTEAVQQLQNNTSSKRNSTAKQNDTADTTATPATLIVAPYTADEAIRQLYGDYVTSEDHTDTTDLRELADAIDNAQAHGIHVIELSTTPQESTPDAVVKLVDAQDIGSAQAQELVTKLDLEHAQKAQPKSIEVFIPSAGDDAFAQAMFHGVWSVLAPYYQKGVLVSPSARLTATSSESSWSSVTTDATSNADLSDQIRARFGFDRSPSATPLLDGVLCGSDQVADHVISALKKAGYTGSSATVNPDITIGGIVKQLTGEADLKRSAVPAPSESATQTPSNSDSTTSNSTSQNTQSDSSTHTSDGTVSEQDNTQHWPIITGYGSTINNVQYLIDGSQWSTSLVNRNTVAISISGMALAYNTKKQPKNIVQQLQNNATRQSTKQNSSTHTDQKTTLHWDTVTVSGETIQVVQTPLLNVSATNLKSVLIDGDYIRPQDIGL